jgi:hypothetical protein
MVTSVNTLTQNGALVNSIKTTDSIMILAIHLALRGTVHFHASYAVLGHIWDGSVTMHPFAASLLMPPMPPESGKLLLYLVEIAQ